MHNDNGRNRDNVQPPYDAPRNDWTNDASSQIQRPRAEYRSPEAHAAYRSGEEWPASDSQPGQPQNAQAQAGSRKRLPTLIIGAILAASLVISVSMCAFGGDDKSFDESKICGGLISFDSLRKDMSLNFTPSDESFEYSFEVSKGDDDVDGKWSCSLKDNIDEISLTITYMPEPNSSESSSALKELKEDRQSMDTESWNITGQKGKGLLVSKQLFFKQGGHQAGWAYSDGTYIDISVESNAKPNQDIKKNFRDISEGLVREVPKHYKSSGDVDEDHPDPDSSSSESTYSFDESNICDGLISMNFLNKELPLSFNPSSDEFKYGYLNVSSNVDPSWAQGRLLACTLEISGGDRQSLSIDYTANATAVDPLSRDTDSDSQRSWTIGGQDGKGKIKLSTPDSVIAIWTYPDGSYLRIKIEGTNRNNLSIDKVGASVEKLIRKVPEHRKTASKSGQAYDSEDDDAN